MGTATGLFRFDGVRFVSWTGFAHQKQLESAEISALLGARDGSLWIGAAYHLFRWKDNTLTDYSTEDEFVNSIIETPDGAIWFTRSRVAPPEGVLRQVQDRRHQCYGPHDGLPLSFAESLAQDTTGNLWIGGNAKLVRWRSGTSTAWTLQALRQSKEFEDVKALAFDRNSSLWVGTKYPGPGRGLGLQQFRDGVWKTFSSPHLNGSRLSVSKLFVDRDGAIWVGTEDQGIFRIIDGTVDHFDNADGLSGDTITDLFQDHEGTIWVATSKGLDSFRDLPVVTLSRREGLHSDGAQSILSSADGTIWIGNVGALDAWRRGAITSILPKDGLPGREVTSLHEDPAGRLWVGLDNGLFLFERRRFVPVNLGVEPGPVTAMTSGADGSVWVLTTSSQIDEQNLVHLQNGDVSERHELTAAQGILDIAPDLHKGIWMAGDTLGYIRDSAATTIPEFGPRYGYIRTIAVDDDGFVWFGATNGLVGLINGKLQEMTTSNGMPCGRINALIFDDHHSLWLSAQCGLIKIEHSELEKWRRDPDVQVKTTTFDVLDGFQGGPSSFRPAATKSADGRLWFINGRVVQTINPDHVYVNRLAPPVQIEQVIADTKSYSPQDTIELPKLSRNIEIRYTALSFVVPQRVLFRYKLDGYDTAWQEAGARRSAFYTNLRPGNYRFQVIASNNDGIWNMTGASLAFSVAPAWFQTNWFRIACVGAFLILMWGLYQLRLQQLGRQFDVRLEERSRIARELHDTLLQSLHGLMFEFQAARNMFHRRPEEALEALDGAIIGTERAISESQIAIEDLRDANVADNDLAQLLRATGEELLDSRGAGRDAPTFGLTVEGERRTLVPVTRNEVYRIAREVLRNAFRHAHAHRIEAEILYDEQQFRLRVRDDGKGMDAQVLEKGGRAGHWGLPGVRERAEQMGAKLDVWSEAGTGTEVQLTVAAAIAYEKAPDRSGFRLFRRTRNHDHRS